MCEFFKIYTKQYFLMLLLSFLVEKKIKNLPMETFPKLPKSELF